MKKPARAMPGRGRKKTDGHACRPVLIEADESALLLWRERADQPVQGSHFPLQAPHGKLIVSACAFFERARMAFGQPAEQAGPCLCMALQVLDGLRLHCGRVFHFRPEPPQLHDFAGMAMPRVPPVDELAVGAGARAGVFLTTFCTTFGFGTDTGFFMRSPDL
jgi:hypothetical protein